MCACALAAGEMAWLVLGLLTALLYGLAALARGEALPMLRVAQFQCVPASAALMWYLRRNAFLRCALQRAAPALAGWLPFDGCMCPWRAAASLVGLCNRTADLPDGPAFLPRTHPPPPTHPSISLPPCRHREVLWFAQRCVVLLATSLPGSFVFTQPAAVPMFAFGLCNLTLEVLTRRVRPACCACPRLHR